MIQVKNHPATKNFDVVLNEIFDSLPYSWGRDSRETPYTVPANIHENAEGYHVELLVPGRQKEDFKVNLEKDVLTISFEKAAEAENNDYKTLRREFGIKSFKRSFKLNEKVNADGIQAKYENGILKFFVPKKEEVKIAPKQITIE